MKYGLIFIGVVQFLIQNSFADYYGNQFAIDDISSVEQISSTVHAVSYRFTTQNSKTLADIRVYAKVVGNPTYYKISLYNDFNGLPGNMIVSTDVYSGSANSGKWLIADIPDTNVIADNLYYIVISTTVDSTPNSVSSTNYIALRRGTPINNLIPVNNVIDTALNSLDYGITNPSNWTIRNLQPVYLLTYIDGNSEGQPYVSLTSVSAGYSIAGSTWIGVQFIIDNSTRVVSQVEFYLKKYGNPADSVYYELRGPNDFSLCLESGTFVNSSEVTTNFSWIKKCLLNKQILSTNNKYWITLKSPGTATTSNTYLLNILNTDSPASYYTRVSYGSTSNCFAKYIVGNTTVTLSEQRDVAFRFTIDNSPPSVITDFCGDEGLNEGEICLTWTSPGDDGTINVLNGGQFVIKYTTNSADDFSSAPYTINFTTTTRFGDRNIYEISSLYPGDTYYFWIRTIDISGNLSVVSNKIIGYSKNVTPEIPTNLRLNNNISEQLIVSWNLNSELDFDGYELYCSSYSNSDGWNLLTDIETTYYIHTGLVAGNTYYYRVSAYDKTNNHSQFSSTIGDYVLGTMPLITQPLTIVKELTTTTQIYWVWTDEFENETEYRIFGNNHQVIAVLPANVTYWLENNLLPNTSYYRYLEVCNQWGNSKSSASVGYTLAKIPLNTQTIVLSTSTILVSWSDNGNPWGTKYELQCSGSPQFTIVENRLIETAVVTRFDSLSENTTYYFRVRAINKENINTDYDCIVSTKTNAMIRENTLSVVINEIAWMGTKANYSNEWIELYNTTQRDIILDGWRIIYSSSIVDGTTVYLNLTGKIVVNGYFLLEKSSDTTITNFSADQVYSAGRYLSNSGELVCLYDSVGTLIDYIDCRKNVAGEWFAGKDSPHYQTMERIKPLSLGNDKNNWATNIGSNGAKDREGNIIYGTPKMRNSISKIADNILPAKITDLVACTGLNQGKINLQWTSTGDDGYIGWIKEAIFQIRYSTNEITNLTNNVIYDKQVSMINIVSGELQSCIISGLNPGTTYYFTIRVQDDAGNWSEWSNNNLNFASAQDLSPEIPKNLQAVAGNRSVTLSWIDTGESDIEYFYILMSTLTSTESFVVVSTDTKTINNLVNGTTYYFRIQLSDYGNRNNGLDSIVLKSELSEIVGCRPRVQPPTQFNVVHKNSYIELNWVATTENNFNIYRAEQKGGFYTQIAYSIPTTVYQDREISPYKEYFYIVRSLDPDCAETDFIESYNSEEISAAPTLVLKENGANRKLLTPNNRQIIFGDKVDRVTVYDIQGRIVWEHSRDSVSELIIWIGENKSGHFVESGIYIYRTEVETKNRHGTIIVVK